MLSNSGLENDMTFCPKFYCTTHVTVWLKHYFYCITHVRVQLHHFSCTMNVTVGLQYYVYYLLLHCPCYRYDISLNCVMHVIVSKLTLTALSSLWSPLTVLCMLRLRNYLYSIMHVTVTANLLLNFTCYGYGNTFDCSIHVTVTALKYITRKR